MTTPPLAEVIALSEKATAGPWYHVQAFQRAEKTMTLHGSVPAQRVDFVSTNPTPAHQKIVIPMEGREQTVKSDDMAFIAALVNWFRASAASLRDEGLPDDVRWALQIADIALSQSTGDAGGRWSETGSPRFELRALLAPTQPAAQEKQA